MEWMAEAIRMVTDVQGIITWGGTAMVCIILFVETGLFVGFFLPGDSLLVTAGVFAAAGHLDITALLILGSISAVVGDQVGYMIGRSAGQALYSRPDSRFFKRSHLEKTRGFYEKYGAKTIVLARVVPIVRTFAPAVAGAAEMNYRRFVSYNVVGGVGWVVIMTLTGYFLGTMIPDIERHIHFVIVVVIVLSIMPAVFEVWWEKRKSSHKKAATEKCSDN